mgnify:CR=1 FL=1
MNKIKLIKSRLIASYYQYLNAGKANKKNMYFRYMGVKRVALLFLNEEEIQSLERRTEWRFVNYLKKINPVIDIPLELYWIKV